jgi:hypothetical protein
MASGPFERPNLHVEKTRKENIILFVGRLNILQKELVLLQIMETSCEFCPDWQFEQLAKGETKNL